MMLRSARSLAVLALTFGACATPLPSPPQTPTKPPAPEAPRPPPASASASVPARLDNRAIFGRLVADVRRLHVFAPQTEKNLGRKWEDELAALGAEFERADTREKLSVAVEHFVNSLRNPHCWYEPAAERDHFTLGFDVNMEWKNGAPIFRVWTIDDASLRSSLKEGDVVVSVDGVPASSLVTVHSLVSRANNRRGIARDIGLWLSHRSSWRSATSLGQTSEWVLAGQNGTTKTVQLVWKEEHDTLASDFAVDYEKTGCAGLWPRRYGNGYELAFSGAKYCIYASKRAPFRDYPIVRHFSFSYYDNHWSIAPVWLVNSDQRNLSAQLASLAPKGIVLDLRDNNGGNNPNWFLDWWAPVGWTDNRVLIRLDDELRDPAARRRAGASLGDGAQGWYQAQLDGRAKGQELTAPRPFFCKPGPPSDPDAMSCAWDNRYVASHRVTTAPVALLVGPGCVSSCDSVALAFDENDFGPLVGEPTAAGYTTSRMKLFVKDASGAAIGALRIAISKEQSGRTGKDIEAVPLHLDYAIDRTWENRDQYDALLVDAALRGFREFRFPASAR
jgi:hypothetical protein